nr:MAG TPA_asm: hypothetical protein [Caudoviricetes sp.]
MKGCKFDYNKATFYIVIRFLFNLRERIDNK